MDKKGSLELSVTTIVILVIAIAVLGLILGFVRAKIGDLSSRLISEEPEPGVATASDPVTVSRYTIETSAKKQVALKVNIYNPTDAEWANARPVLNCPGAETFFPAAVDQKTISKTITQGSAQSFSLVFKTGNTPRGETYVCEIREMTNTAYQTDITINIV